MTNDENVSNTMPVKLPSISVFPGNITGNDYITSDPHACLDVFQQVLEKLKDGDRLFVCGDLVDRGPDSLGLLRCIKTHNKKNPQKPIHAIRGNHEDSALRVLLHIECLIESLPEEKSRQILQKCSEYDYLECCENSEYHVSFGLILDQLIVVKDNILVKVIYSELCNGAAWLCALSPAERAEVKAFIEPLPYMMRIQAIPGKGISAFDIVHAAPLAEQTIRGVIYLQRPFTWAEISYMTWARPGGARIPMLEYERNQDSIRTYVGHNPLMGGESIYSAINVVNVDLDSFWSKGMCCINHTKAEVEYVGGCLGERNKIFAGVVIVQKIKNIMLSDKKQRLGKATGCWSFFFGSSAPVRTIFVNRTQGSRNVGAIHPL